MARSRAGSTRGKKTNTISMDLSGVEARVTVPEDTYRLKVVEVTKEDGDKAEYLKWVYEITDGEFEGQKIYNNTSLSPQSLWNVKANLLALRFDIPEDAFDLDPEDLVDLEMMGTIEHESYNGKKQARLVDFTPVDAEEDEPEKEEPKGKAARGKGKKKEVQKVAQDDIDDMSEEELEELNGEHDLEVDLSEFKTIRKKRIAISDALEEKDLLESE